ncbi:unnamed protein product, partial [marine sediment metagenome]
NKQINPFDVRKQYSDGVNLYEYVGSSPGIDVDPWGLTSDIGFFLSFWKHRYFGFGQLWTSGASRLKEQSRVKGPTQRELYIFASQKCKLLPANGECHIRGSVILNVPYAFANDTWGMKASLNHPHNYFIQGFYSANKFESGGECLCAVHFLNKYIWFDMGDLNLEHEVDKVLSRVEKRSIIGKMLAIDFPVEIEWIAGCNVVISYGGHDWFSGWPFD